MAFDPTAFAQKYSGTSVKPTGAFDPTAFAKRIAPMGVTPQGGKGKLDSSSELYNQAVRSGLKDDADRIATQLQGEKPKEIFSGGLISDIFDGLSAMQYGVTGLLKGKSFSEGVKTRQSFSDKDAFGDNGIPGIIAGIALDIAVDPLTYIAPATILKKIPLLSKLLKGGKELAFGKMTEKAIEGGEAGRTFQSLEGGTNTGRFLADKFSYMFGKDPNYKEAFEKMTKNIGVASTNFAEISKGLSELTDEVASKILTKDKTGRIARIGIEELRKTLSPEDFAKVEPAWDKIDELGKQAVDVGLLSKEKFEDNIGEYIKNAYTDYELAKSKNLFGFKKIGVKGIKSRVEGLTSEQMRKLGQIDNPAYLVFKSTFDLMKDVENAKFFNEVKKTFGSNVPLEGFAPIYKYGDKLKFFRQTFEPAEDILKQIEMQNFSKGATVPQLLEQSFTKVGKAIQFAEESGLKVSKKARGSNLGSATLGGIAKGGRVNLKAFISDTIAHELGHSFDTGLSKVINTKKFYKEELTKVTKFMGLGGSEKYQAKAVERFAEYVSLYIHTPQKANELAPEFTKLFETELLPKNEISDLVGKLGDFFQKVDKLPNIKTPLKELDNANYLETAIRKAFPSKSFVGVAKEKPFTYVPEDIAQHIGEIIKPEEMTFGKKLIGDFKFNKVVLNPATHARNVMSNMILNWWKLGIGPWRVDKYADAVKEVATNGEMWKRAQAVGGGIDTFASQELVGLLDDPAISGFGSKLGKAWGGIKKKLGNTYQFEENVAKMTAFSDYVKKGFSDEEAWKAAESATFNYAQVTPFVRKLRTALFGFPFITFALKATPVALETSVKNPQRIAVFGKIKNALESAAGIQETERERASEPPWVKDGFYVKLPFKDKEGRSAYFDLTYILPFGDLVSGQFTQTEINRESGLPEPKIISLASNMPMVNLIKELYRNQDFYGDKIWEDSATQDKKLGDIMRHLSKTYLPPLVADNIPGGHQTDGTRRQRGFVGALLPQEKESQQRTLMQEMFRNIGAKVQPVDVDIQESMSEWNKKKAFQTLLQEKGIIKGLNINYVPKK